MSPVQRLSGDRGASGYKRKVGEEAGETAILSGHLPYS